MGKAEVIDVVNKFASIVGKKYNCVDVILFGSYAKGSGSKDSDIDIAVVLNDFESSLKMQLELMRIRRSIDSRIEPHPFRLKDFNKSNPLASEIIEFGEKIDFLSLV